MQSPPMSVLVLVLAVLLLLIRLIRLLLVVILPSRVQVQTGMGMQVPVVKRLLLPLLRRKPWSGSCKGGAVGMLHALCLLSTCSAFSSHILCRCRPNKVHNKGRRIGGGSPREGVCGMMGRAARRAGGVQLLRAQC